MEGDGFSVVGKQNAGKCPFLISFYNYNFNSFPPNNRFTFYKSSSVKYNLYYLKLLPSREKKNWSCHTIGIAKF